MSTKITCEEDAEQLFASVKEYIMDWFPAPAIEGLKEFPVTPAPEYVPPTGLPGLNVIGAQLIHTVEGDCI